MMIWKENQGGAHSCCAVAAINFAFFTRKKLLLDNVDGVVAVAVVVVYDVVAEMVHGPFCIDRQTVVNKPILPTVV